MSEIAQEFLLKTVEISDLFPTLVRVGCAKSRASAGNGAFPVILGPDAHHYIIDRHHLTLALHDEGIGEVPVSIVADMRKSDFGEFWTTLESRGWTHPFDDEGRRRPYGDMPTAVDDLIDDPFRSLAGAVKRTGGYLWRFL